MPVWSLSAAVDGDVFEPLDVRLRVAEYSTHEGHIAANHCGLVGRETRLQDGSVRGTFWNIFKKVEVSISTSLYNLTLTEGQ